MAINNKLILFVVLLFITTINSTCKKFFCSDSNTYTFINNPTQVYPNMDSIHVGDTVWIDFNLPEIFKDTLTSQMINYSNCQNFGNHISVVRFIGGSLLNPGSIYAAKNFKWILSDGKLAPTRFPDEGQSYYFLEKNNSYLLKIGIIADSLGIYALAISDAGGVYRKNNKCTKAFFAFQFTNTNQHLYYYQNNRPAYVISGYELQHMYCFKVY